MLSSMGNRRKKENTHVSCGKYKNKIFSSIRFLDKPLSSDFLSGCCVPRENGVTLLYAPIKTIHKDLFVNHKTG